MPKIRIGYVLRQSSLLKFCLVCYVHEAVSFIQANICQAGGFVLKSNDSNLPNYPVCTLVNDQTITAKDNNNFFLSFKPNIHIKISCLGNDIILFLSPQMPLPAKISSRLITAQGLKLTKKKIQ